MDTPQDAVFFKYKSLLGLIQLINVLEETGQTYIVHTGQKQIAMAKATAVYIGLETI